MCYMEYVYAVMFSLSNTRVQDKFNVDYNNGNGNRFRLISYDVNYLVIPILADWTDIYCILEIKSITTISKLTTPTLIQPVSRRKNKKTHAKVIRLVNILISISEFEFLTPEYILRNFEPRFLFKYSLTVSILSSRSLYFKFHS